MNRTVAIIAGLLVLALVAGAGVGIFFWSATPDRSQTAETVTPDVAPADTGAAPSPTPATPQASGQQQDEQPAVPAGPRRPSFDIVRVSPDGFAVFAGRAEAAWKVFLRDQNKAYGSVAADARGEWVITLDDPLAPGTYEFGLIARNASGSKQAESLKPVLITVPERDNGKKSLPLVVELGDDKQGSRVLQAEGVGPGQNASQLTLDAIDYANDGTAVMSGTAPTGTTLRVYIDNEDLGDAVTSDGAHWSIPTKSVVAAGPHLVRIDELDTTGKVISRVEAVFERVDGNVAAGGGASGSNYQVEDGNSLWRIARRYYGDGFLYTEIFQANRSKIADPDLIYPGQIFVLPRPTQNYDN